MKIRNIAIILVLLAGSLFFTSCAATDTETAALLVGIWADDTNDLAIQFFDNGRCRFGGDDVYTDTSTQLSWTVTSSHIEFSDMLNFYSSSYVYDLSSDGDTLYLYLVATGILNTSYDSLYPGDVFSLTKQADDADFTTIVDEFDSYYY